MAFNQATDAYIAAQLMTKEETAEVDQLFRAIDVDGNGNLTNDEIKTGNWEMLVKKVSDALIDQLFDAVDADGGGPIGYSEFGVATMNSNAVTQGNKLEVAFKKFDSDNSGSTSKEEL